MRISVHRSVPDEASNHHSSSGPTGGRSINKEADG